MNLPSGISLEHPDRSEFRQGGRTHTGTRGTVLAQDLEIRVINAATGELIRELVLDTSRRYQGTGAHPDPGAK